MTDTMNVNAYSYRGTATTTSGASALSDALLPDFSKVERIVVQNNSADYIIIKTGNSSVTVAYPASGDTATSGTIVGPGKEISVKKEKSHTTFAVDSLSGSADYVIQYGDGN